MDMRTGRLYESEEAAKVAGALAGDVVPVDSETINGREVIRVASGPFKGRVYAVENGRRGRRLREMETAQP